MSEQSSKGVHPRLLDLLVCPLTKGPLRYDAEAQELISDGARLAYPIRDGIPIMLVDEARAIEAPAPGEQAAATLTGHPPEAGR